jgi:hypothetical protein
VLGQWRKFAPNYFGDYYPLTPYSLDKSAWIAWQFDCPEAGEGMVQAFRRTESVYETIRVRLRGLEPEARYELTNLDAAGSRKTTGRELMEKGLPIAITDQPGSVVFVYRRQQAQGSGQKMSGCPRTGGAMLARCRCLGASACSGSDREEEAVDLASQSAMIGACPRRQREDWDAQGM